MSGHWRRATCVAVCVFGLASASVAEPAIAEFKTLVEGTLRPAQVDPTQVAVVEDKEPAPTKAEKPKGKKAKTEKSEPKADAQKSPQKTNAKTDAKPDAKSDPKKPDPKQADGKAPPASWPKTVDEAKAEADAKAAPPATWSNTEIADAKARCAVILKRIKAVAIEQPPIRQGACGTPAPVQLISIGANPQVAISPPATLTCDMAEALDTWINRDLQPLAKKSLGAEIIRVENMSDYSCRNAYGRVKSKLSEHGTANALDIRGFVTSKGSTSYVLEHWGTPEREIIAARIAVEKQKAAAAAAAIAANAATKVTADKAAVAATIVGTATRKVTITTEPVPAPAIDKPFVKPTAPIYGLTDDGPSHLGGPKDGASSGATNNAAFLKAAHTFACKIFGTTLGPEANAAHRNHFHVDMAPRKSKKICE